MRFSFSIVLTFVIAIAIHSQTVKHVSDGDSFILSSGERVRMIGINAPELADKFGPESKEHLASLIRGKTVTLERDPQNDDRDIHGRLLRYVSVDGIDVNRQMISDGYASAFLRYRFAREKRDAYREAESNARAAMVGIWATDVASDSTRPSNSPPIEIEPQPSEPLIPRGVKWIGVAVILVLVLVALRYAMRR